MWQRTGGSGDIAWRIMHWMKYHFNGKDEHVWNAEEGELEREVGRDGTLAP